MGHRRSMKPFRNWNRNPFSTEIRRKEHGYVSMSMQSSSTAASFHIHTYIHSVQFSSRWYLCPQKSPYVLHLVSQKFPHRRFWKCSNSHLIDDGLLSSFQRRSSSASSFHTSLLQVINRVMSLAMCLNTYVHTCTHTHTHAHTCTYTHAHTHTHHILSLSLSLHTHTHHISHTYINTHTPNKAS